MTIMVTHLLVHPSHALLAAGADVDGGTAGHFDSVAVAVNGEAVVTLAQIVAAVATKYT